MPRRSIYASTKEGQYAELLTQLVHELRHPKASGQPLILEDELRASRDLQVYVIWDRLVELRFDRRSDLILDAYEEAFGIEHRDRILVALGLTVPEAIERGLLPFSVQPGIPTNGAAWSDDIRRALTEDGASILRDPSHPDLRFETIEQALTAQMRLKGKLPGSEWTIHEEVY